MKSKIKKYRIWLISALSFLMTAVLVLSGVGIYFHFSKDKGKGKLNPTETVKPLDWATDVWDGKTVSALDFNGNYAGRGDYTKTINSAESFIHFINEVNSGKDFKDYTIYLNSHIDLNGHTINSIGSSDKPFKGTFDGSYYTIQNAKINGTALFEYTEDATIKNIGTYNCEITTSESVAAGLIRKAVNTNIENTFVRSGKITSAQNVAGLVGEYISNNGKHYIKNCFADTTLNAVSTLGLIYSINTNNSSQNEITIENCYYTNTESAYSIVDNINFVDDDTNVVKATNINEFNTNGFDYHANYDNNKPWTNYTYKEGSKALSFTYPVLRQYVKTFLTGSNYESVVVENGQARDASTLKEALKTTSANVEINIIVEEVYVDEQAEAVDTDVQINVMQDTTILRSEKNEESIFVASGTSNLVIGNNGLTRSGETNIITIDGNREAVESNNLESGALIVSNGNNVEIHNNVVLKDNINTTTKYGGAVLLYNTDQQATVNATISNCYAENGGGGICSVGTAPATLAGINNCSTNGNGGGALIVDELEDIEAVQTISKLYGSKHKVKPLKQEFYQNVIITPSNWNSWSLTENDPYTYTGNTAGQGGVFYLSGAGLKVEYFSKEQPLKFVSNTADTTGGAISAWASSINLEYCEFESNSAEDGGAVFVSDGGNNNSGYTNTLKNCTFKNNTASISGGAVYFSDYLEYVTLTITNSSFKGNESANGGAIYCDNYGTTTIENTEFCNNNTMYGYGSSIFCASNLSLENVSFDDSGIDTSNYNKDENPAVILMKETYTQDLDDSITHNVALSSVTFNTLNANEKDVEPLHINMGVNDILDFASDNPQNNIIKVYKRGLQTYDPAFDNVSAVIAKTNGHKIYGTIFVKNLKGQRYLSDPNGNLEQFASLYYDYTDYTTGQNAGTYGSGYALVLNVYPKLPELETTTFTYDGNYKTPYIKYLDINSSTFSGDIGACDAAKYEIKIVNNDKTWYIAPGETSTDKTITLTWEIKAIKIDKPTLGTSEFRYDGTIKAPTINGFDENTMTISGITEASACGTYDINITPKINYAWSDETNTTITLTWNIYDPNYRMPKLSSSKLTYDGRNKTPTILNFDEAKMTKSGETTAYDKGTYEITVSLKNGYTWENGTNAPITLTWSIVMPTDWIYAAVYLPSHFTWNGTTITGLTNIGQNALNTSNVKQVFIPDVTVGGGTTVCTAIADTAFSSLNISKIYIPNTIKTIGASAFKSNTNLNNIVFEAGSALTAIGDNAFSGASNLKEIEIPSLVTSIGSAAFQNCSELAKVTFEGNKLTTLSDSLFEGCKALESITLPTTVKSIGSSTFADCISLKKVNLDGELTSIGKRSFKNCYVLTELNTIYEGSRVTNKTGLTEIPDEAFYNCESLETIRMPNVVTIGNEAFYCCLNLHNVYFNKNSGVTTNSHKLKTIGDNAFEGCVRLEDISLSSILTTVGIYAFSGCDLLRRVDNFENTKITTISEGTFYGCGRLWDIALPYNLTTIGAEAFRGCRGLGTKGGSTIYGIEFPSTLTEIGDNAFRGTQNLGPVTGAENLETIGAYSFYNSGITSINGSSLKTIGNYAFYSCSYLEYIYGFSNSSVEYIPEYAFSNCTKLTNENENDPFLPKDLTEIGSAAFRYTYSLTHITVPTSLTTIGNSAFYHSALNINFVNDSIKSIEGYAFAYTNITEARFSNAETIGENAFRECGSLTTVDLPKIKSLGQQAFYKCSSLTNVTLGGTFTEIPYQAFYYTGNINLDIYGATVLTKIKDEAFYNSGISELILPDTMKEIGVDAFYNCDSLMTLKFNEGLETLGYGAFRYSANLNNIILPPSLTNMGEKVFYGCTKLRVVYVDKDQIDRYPTDWEEIAKDDSGNRYHLFNVITYSLTDNEATIVKLISKSAYLLKESYELVSKIFTKPVTTIGTEAFKYSNIIQKTIILPSTLKTIEDRAFQGIADLTEITIPASVTTLGTMAFGSSNLEIVTFEEGNQITALSNSLFNSCTKLTTINIPKTVTTIGYSTFRYTYALEGITLPTSLTTIGNYAFAYSAITEIIGIENSNLETIGNYAFSHTKLGNFSSQAKSLGTGAFEICTALTEVSLTNLSSLGQQAFYKCRSLTNVTLGGTFTAIPYQAFYQAGKDMVINVSNATELNTIGEEAFYNASLSDWDISSVKLSKIENKAFMNVKITTISISATEIGANVFYEANTLKNVTLYNVETMGRCAFYNCSALDVVKFENTTLTEIPEDTFYKSTLKTFTFPETITKIGNSAFLGCKNLTDFYFNEGLTTITYAAFWNARINNVKEVNGKTYNSAIVIPSTVTDIGIDSFRSVGLDYVEIAEGSKLEKIWEGAFYNNYFTEFKLPATVKTIGNSAFQNCELLTSINLDNVQEIGALAFYCCYALEEVEFVDLKTLGNESFRRSGLKNVIFSTTGPTEIRAKAFRGCWQLNTIYIPSSITTFGENIFEDCTDLENIIASSRDYYLEYITAGHNLAKYSQDLTYEITLTYRYIDGTEVVHDKLFKRSVDWVKDNNVWINTIESIYTMYTLLPNTSENYNWVYLEDVNTVVNKTNLNFKYINGEVIDNCTIVELGKATKLLIEVSHSSYGDLLRNNIEIAKSFDLYYPYGSTITINGTILTITYKQNGTYINTYVALPMAGSSFVGWYEEGNATKLTTDITLTGEKDIIAQFTESVPDSKYFVKTYHPYYGDIIKNDSETADRFEISYSSGTIATVNGNNLTINGNTYTPVEKIIDGKTFTFMGWYVNNEKITSKAIVNNVNIVARFAYGLTVQTIPEFNGDLTVSNGRVTDMVFFDIQSGDTLTINGNTLTFKGTTIVATSAMSYEFLGWYDGEKQIIDGTITLNGTTLLFAKFDTDSYYNLTVNSLPQEGGDVQMDSAGWVKSFNTEYQQYIKVNIYDDYFTYGDTTVTKQALETDNYTYEFLGWYLGDIKLNAGEEYQLKGDVVITAKFQATIKKYDTTITICHNDCGDLSKNDTQTADSFSYSLTYGTIITTTGNKLNITDGDSITSVPTAENDGVSYNFLGWFIVGTNTQITDSYTVTGDVTIEARFEKMLTITLNETKGYISVKDAEGNSVMYTETFEKITEGKSNKTFKIPADKQFKYYILPELTNNSATNSYEILDIQFLNETISLYTPRDTASEIELGEAIITSPKTITLTYTSAYLMNIEIPSATVIGLTEFKTTNESGRIVEYSNKYLIATGTKFAFKINSNSADGNTQYKYISITYTKDGVSKTISVNSKTEDIKYVENVNGVYSYTIECDNISYITIKVEKLVIVTPNTDVEPENSQNFVLSATFTSEDNLTEELDGDSKNLFLYRGRWYITTTTMTETDLENVLDNKYDVVYVSEGMYYVDIE